MVRKGSETGDSMAQKPPTSPKEKVSLLRKASHTKIPLKEKIVQIYEAFFRVSLVKMFRTKILEIWVGYLYNVHWCQLSNILLGVTQFFGFAISGNLHETGKVNVIR